MVKVLRCATSGAISIALVTPLVAGALGWTASVVETGSMDVASGYAVGDLVVTAPFERHKVAVGEVVRVRGPRSSSNDVVQRALEVLGRADPGYVHRVVELQPDGVVLTQGDANNAADAPHARSDLAGRVVAHASKAVGTAWTMFRSIPAQVVLAVLAVLLWPTSTRKRRRPATSRSQKRHPATVTSSIDPLLDGQGGAGADVVGRVRRRELGRDEERSRIFTSGRSQPEGASSRSSAALAIAATRSSSRRSTSSICTSVEDGDRSIRAPKAHTPCVRAVAAP